MRVLDCAILPEDGCGAPFPGLIVEPRSLFRFLELLMTAIMSTYFQSKRKLDGSYKEKNELLYILGEQICKHSVGFQVVTSLLRDSVEKRSVLMT